MPKIIHALHSSCSLSHFSPDMSGHYLVSYGLSYYVLDVLYPSYTELQLEVIARR